MKSKDLVVFWDWNGTLVDDAFVFVDVLNVLLERNSLQKISLEFYKKNFCFPVVDFYKKLGLYKNSSFFSALNKDFIELYNQRKYEPKLKKNISKLIYDLNKINIKQYVVSAQENQTLLGLISFYGLNKYFVRAVGVNNDFAFGKNKLAKKLKNSLCQNNIILVVGDTLLDFEVANHIKGECVLVDWGHYSLGRLSCCGVPVLSSVKELGRFFVKRLELTSL